MSIKCEMTAINNLHYIYDYLCISCLADIFVFANGFEVLSDSHKYFTSDFQICCFTFMIS